MIAGHYSSGHISSTTDCVLSLDTDGNLCLQGVDIAPCPIHDADFSTRIANTPRYINFPDGGVFETDDNDAVDTLLSRFGDNRSIAHRLESSYPLVAVMTIAVILFAWVFVEHGIPAISKQLAFMVPEEHARILGHDVLATLDEHIFEESSLHEDRKQHYQDIFTGLSESVGSNGLQLVFRYSKPIGANAFALPDGTIVFTDDMIELAEHDHEIASIMLHEIGHIENRHSLRMAIQGLGLAAFVAIITGDVSTSSTILTGLPVLLVESGYSRIMETEADSYALDSMLVLGIDPGHFANIMSRLETDAERRPGSCNDDPTTDTSWVSDYFSSHPGTDSRIERFRNHVLSE